MTGHLFLTIFTFGMSLYGTPSLNQLVGLLNLVVPHLDLSRQALHERINEAAVEFFEEMLSVSVKLTLPKSLDLSILDQFARVLIFDGTSFQLPDTLCEYFSGSGGDASESAIKILFGYDLKSLRFFYIITDGTTPDSLKESGILDYLAPNDLEISDLGFFKISTFIEMDQKGIFYLSRLKSNVTLYRKGEDGQLELFDLVEFVNNMSLDRMEIEIYLKSGGQCTKTRLIIEKATEEVKAKRLQKLHKINQKKGRTTKKRTKILAGFNLHITNTPPETIQTDQVRTLYSIRWQIELAFKVWKSNFSLDKVTGERPERIKCMIYAKLLFIFISTKLVSVARSYTWLTAKREISMDQAAKHIKIIIQNWLTDTVQNPENVQHILKNAINFICKHCRKGKSKERTYPLEILEQIQQGALA